MQHPKTPAKSPRRSRISADLVILVLFAFMAGALLGAGALFTYQQLILSPSSSAQPPQPNSPFFFPEAPPQNDEQGHDSTTQVVPTTLELPGDGFFLVEPSGQLIRVEGRPTVEGIDLSALPATSSRSPIIAIRGENLPLGSLAFHEYTAGLGVDLDFSQSGATVLGVAPNGPAANAGLLPGEVIVSVDGEPPKRPNGYTVGENDLFGVMHQSVTLEVAAGYTSEFTLFRMDSRVSFRLEPRGDFVLLFTEEDLEPGAYAVEFPLEVVHRYGVGLEPTATPTVPPIPLPQDKWIFVVR
jgi:membrane-associated protease RseP (regulator of RpoE activity)